MTDPNQIMDYMKGVVDSTEEPALILVNFGDECYLVGNKEMTELDPKEKSGVFHLCVSQLSDSLTEYEDDE